MKYSEKASALAAREIDARRTAAEEEQLRREQEIVEKVPEIGVLRKQQRDNYIALIKLVAKHSADAAAAAAEIREKSLAASESIAVLLEKQTGDRGYLDTKYTCPKCRDTGYVEGVRCECLEELLKKYSLEELNSDSSIKLHDFTEFRKEYYPEGEVRARMEQCCKMLKDYCDKFTDGARSLLFVGETGVGKTFFSSCIVSELGKKGVSAAFMSAFDMLRTLENEHFGRTEGNTMDHLISAPLLVIDDLGSEPAVSKKIYESFLYNIINGRINRLLPTIISTNISGALIEERYGARLASRILCEFVPVMFRGMDIRQIKSAERNRRLQGG